MGAENEEISPFMYDTNNKNQKRCDANEFGGRVKHFLHQRRLALCYFGQYVPNLSIDLRDISERDRCGNRCDTRDGTASIEARTVRSTPNHAASTSAASTSDPLSFAA